jgi:hypothetical protein
MSNSPRARAHSEYSDDGIGDEEVVAVDEDSYHEHLMDLPEDDNCKTLKIGSNNYTTAQKNAGAIEMKQNFEVALSSQRTGSERSNMTGPQSVTFRLDDNTTDEENQFRRRGFSSASSDSNTSGASGLVAFQPDDEDDESEQTGPCGAGCFGDPLLPSTPIYTVTWIVTAVVMSLLKYVFCVVGAVIIHDSHKLLQTSVSVGIYVQCSSTLITCLYTGRFSKIGINVSGPDIIASIFVSSWVKTLCEGDGAILTEETALPTILFLMTLSTFIMGIIWFAIGHFHATKIVEYLPAPLVCGFLSCIGWKVAKYATKVSAGDSWYHAANYFWPFLLTIPGLFMGVPLWFLKKYHFGNPMIILPYFMLAPIIAFYICVLISGQSMESLRENQWLFPEYEAAPFQAIWTSMDWSKINYNAIPAIMTDLCIMIVILVIDSLLKLSSTKTGCQVEIDMGYEMKHTGYENLIGTLFMASPGYPQGMCVLYIMLLILSIFYFVEDVYSRMNSSFHIASSLFFSFI